MSTTFFPSPVFHISSKNVQEEEKKERDYVFQECVALSQSCRRIFLNLVQVSLEAVFFLIPILTLTHCRGLKHFA